MVILPASMLCQLCLCKGLSFFIFFRRAQERAIMSRVLQVGSSPTLRRDGDEERVCGEVGRDHYTVQ
jgi:hypothetical protein